MKTATTQAAAPAPRNRHIDAHRARRARVLHRHFWRMIPREWRTNPDLAAGLRDVPAEERKKFGKNAGLETPPSTTTWEMFVVLVEEAVSDERHWLSLDQPGASA